MSELKYIFGPVPSRRLGRSLGVNIVPSKICSMDCIYCEVGRTVSLTTIRKPYFRGADIVREFEENLPYFKDSIDVVTITGFGEPTLNSDLKIIFDGIKRASGGIPVAILTNSTMLHDKDVYDTLLGFDIVVPSLDAVSERAFRSVDRQDSYLTPQTIIDDLIRFSHQYKGRLYLEILLCKGLNDSIDELELLAGAASKICADKIQIGTVHRPPAYSEARPLNDEELLNAVKLFISKGLPASAPGNFTSLLKGLSDISDIRLRIKTLLQARPCTLADIAGVFGITESDAETEVTALTAEGSIVYDDFNGEKYYSHRNLDVMKHDK